MNVTLRDIFPSRKLLAQEIDTLYRGGVVLTVDRVEPRSKESSQGQETWAVLYFVESKKPISLNLTNAQQLAQITGSESIADWSGALVKVVAMPIEVPDQESGGRKMVMGIRLFPAPKGEVPPPGLIRGSDWTLLAKSERARLDRTSAKATPELPAVPIGIDSAVSMVIELEKRGKSIDFAVSHLQKLSMGPLVIGKMPPEWPETVKPPLKKLLAGFPATVKVDPLARAEELRALWTPPPAEPEVIDPKTGEVISKRAGTGKPGEDIDPDDIPF